jgi:membrane fusion protein (multidrug efflux system)
MNEPLRSEETLPLRDPQPPQKSYVGRIVLLVIVGALVAWTAVRYHAASSDRDKLLTERSEATEAAKKDRKDKPLEFATGTATTWTPSVRIEGTLQPVEEADLAFKVTGKLASIRAQLRVAEAALKLADDSAMRSATLVKKGAGSAQSDLQAQEQRNSAAAQLDAAKAQVQLAQANVSNMTLVAPFPGYVTKVPPGAGQVFTFGTTLFHLQNTAELKLVGTVGEGDVGLVSPGLPVDVHGPDGDVRGTVTAVLGSVDSATRRVPLEAKVPNDPKHPLLAGTYVRADVVGKEPVAVVQVPAAALRPGSQDEVMVVEGTHMRAHRIVFHPADGGLLYVRSGLSAQDRVVLEPSPEAKDGDALPAAEVTK